MLTYMLIIVFFLYTIVPLCIFAPLCIVINIYMFLTGPWKLDATTASAETPREAQGTELPKRDASAPSFEEGSNSRVVDVHKPAQQVDKPVKPAGKNPRRRFDPSRDRIKLTAASREETYLVEDAEQVESVVKKNERKRVDPNANRLKKGSTIE